MLSSSVGAWCTTDGEKDSPALDCPVLNYFGFTTKQIDFCTDWSCTTPFNAFTGSQLVAVNDSGTVDGADEIAVNLPTSGTYSYIRILVNNDFLMNGYGKEDTNSWCATGTTTVYATEALAKAAATDTTFAFQLDKFFKAGNGVDEIGIITYGYLSGLNHIPGYKIKDDTSAVNEYTTIYRVESGQNNEFSFTTVLQGDYDFGLGIPSTINFGITVTKYGSITAALANDETVEFGKSLTAHGGCIMSPSGFVWDFVIS